MTAVRRLLLSDERIPCGPVTYVIRPAIMAPGEVTIIEQHEASWRGPAFEHHHDNLESPRIPALVQIRARRYRDRLQTMGVM